MRLEDLEVVEIDLSGYNEKFEEKDIVYEEGDIVRVFGDIARVITTEEDSQGVTQLFLKDYLGEVFATSEFYIDELLYKRNNTDKEDIFEEIRAGIQDESRREFEAQTYRKLEDLDEVFRDLLITDLRNLR